MKTILRCRIVLNKDGGTLKTSDARAIAAKLAAALQTRPMVVTTTIVAGKEVANALETAASDVGVDCIIVGGGDGSVSLAASLCWKHKKILGVLPAGTMNFFARSLQMPLELDAAINALATAEVRNVDIGTVNGHVFVHQVSLGIQPRMVELRKSIPYRSRIGKMAASVRAALKVLTSPPSFRARLISDSVNDNSRYSILAISNNVYGDGHLPFADKIDDGILGIYTSPRLTFAMNIKLARDMLLGRWTDNEHFLSQSIRAVRIEVLSKTAGRKISVDGELMPLERVLDIQLHPLELKVLMPK